MSSDFASPDWPFTQRGVVSWVTFCIIKEIQIQIRISKQIWQNISLRTVTTFNTYTVCFPCFLNKHCNLTTVKCAVYVALILYFIFAKCKVEHFVLNVVTENNIASNWRVNKSTEYQYEITNESIVCKWTNEGLSNGNNLVLLCPGSDIFILPTTLYNCASFSTAILKKV